ncbi:hypothetical protein DER46DRAFT_654246 [Fusarium sp. MPI-SDFR-AT-0072]|nr:hypothetical protein DER46DRAFT_654246 [Fusarium sp. MPI-SDFR-AT-0072]
MPSIYTLNHGAVEKERQRLDFQHGVFKAIMCDHLPPVIWQQLKSLPAPRFHDPASLPANVKLQYGTVLEPFPKECLGTYDLVHVKLLYAALKKDEWLQAMKNLKTLLNPDGYLFWSEIGAYGYASNPYSATLHEWKSIESAVAFKFGLDPK